MRPLLTAALIASLSLPVAAEAGTRAWVSSNHIQVVDLDEGRVVGRIALKEFIHDFEFSAKGDQVWVASTKGLRIADPEKLAFTQHVNEATTLAVAASGAGLVAALHLPPEEDARAARKARLPLPPSTVALYREDGSVAASWEVDGQAYDVAISPDGSRVYVLVPPEGKVKVFDGSGAAMEEIQVGPAAVPGHHPDAMLSRMALSPTGETLAIPVTDKDTSSIAEIDLTGRRPQAERVLMQDLGHSKRIQGLRWDDDGSGVYVTALASMVKFNGYGFPVAWQAYPVNFVDVAPVRDTTDTVMVTPTFSKARGSGAVALVDRNGELVRSVELLDMSPFLVAIQP